MKSTIKKRRELWTQLSKNMDRWAKMSDEELLAEVKTFFAAVSQANRNEMLKMLVMDHTDKMVE